MSGCPTVEVLLAREEEEGGEEEGERRGVKYSDALTGKPGEPASREGGDQEPVAGRSPASEPGEVRANPEPGPGAASRMASSQVLNLSWPRAERAGSGEGNWTWGYWPWREERRGWTSRAYCPDLLGHQRAKGPRFFQAAFLNLFSWKMMGSSGE